MSVPMSGFWSVRFDHYFNLRNARVYRYNLAAPLVSRDNCVSQGPGTCQVTAQNLPGDGSTRAFILGGIVAVKFLLSR